MAKESAKGAKGVPNKHLRARISFLRKAAEYIASQQPDTRQKHGVNSAHAAFPGGVKNGTVPMSKPDSTVGEFQTGDISQASMTEPPSEPQISPGMPAYLCSQLRQVALKSQIRLAPTTKQTCCKRCNSFMVEGQNCHRFTENLSRGAKKPHANLTVLECSVCGAKKRWPVGAVRQSRKDERQRSQQQNEAPSVIENELLPT